jgi:signal transduction histidine kinase
MTSKGKAIEMLLRALHIRRELGEEKRSMFTLNNLAVAYGVKGDTEKSIAYADTAIAVALKYGNKMVAGVVCGGMGHALNEQKRYEESIRWCERAIAYLTAAKREANMVFPLCNMAAAYIGLGQFAKALEVNQRGWAIMQKLNLQEPIDPYHENFANAYAGLGDFENAYRWHKNLFCPHRFDNGKRQSRQGRQHRSQIWFGKKERQLSEQRAENFRQRVGIYSLAAALLAFLVLGYLFWNRFRLRKKAELDDAVIREQQLSLNAVIEAQEAERKRIAKELHDGIAQELVALKLGFNVLQQKLGADEAAQLDVLSRQLDVSGTEVRNTAHLMLPPMLEQKGLAPSLEMLLRNSFQPAGIQAEFEHHGLPENLDEKIKLGLYRIAQELVNNIVKHAEAQKVSLQLYKTGPNLVMKMEDNGKGYDFEKAKQQGSMGLLNILSRVRTLGGAFFAEPVSPHGMASTVRVPAGGTEAGVPV